ncbi:hypothetical protein B0I35DRAFT_402967 [Stachybotrys elegans]|uniref:BZIP domain-containing protein n=1 Tax=Stachybotrys elegans TaxID=80388 RepID=A0A8K0SCR1_9HYPO|nr:hypothetical protein B0I35DRAFT_402967 [Stachybotrys elegans]
MAQAASANLSNAPRRKGTRSVSSLSPAQLERKRANDREAQRAIRQRTRVHIEKLEADVESLKASTVSRTSRPSPSAIKSSTRR